MKFEKQSPAVEKQSLQMHVEPGSKFIFVGQANLYSF